MGKRAEAGRMKAFLGRFLRTLDSKGRLSLPSKYGKSPGKAYVVTRGLDRCLSHGRQIGIFLHLNSRANPTR